MAGEQSNAPPDLGEIYKSAKIEFRDAYPLTPEVLRGTWQAFWDYHAKQGNRFVVPSLSLGVEQLQELRRVGRQLLYFPSECRDFGVLREIFPDQFAGSDTNALGRIEPARFHNSHNSEGWLAIESTLVWDPEKEKEPPQGYTVQPLRLAPYIAASQAAKEFWGGYSHFDVNAATLIPGSSLDGQHILAFHAQSGETFIRPAASAHDLPYWYGSYQSSHDFSDIPARTELVLPLRYAITINLFLPQLFFRFC